MALVLLLLLQLLFVCFAADKKIARYQILDIKNPVVEKVYNYSDSASCTIYFDPANEKQEGYDYVVIETNAKLSNADQAFCAGYIEAYVNNEGLKNNYLNHIKSNGAMEYEDFIVAHGKNLERNVALNDNGNDGYWQASTAVLNLVKGTVAGYNAHPAPGLDSMTDTMVYYLNMEGDFDDLEGILSPEKHMEKIRNGLFHRCSGVICLIDDSSDIILAHTTWTGLYTSFNRVMREYIFHFDIKAGKYNPASTEQKISFSSYPGLFFSLDDFYISRVKFYTEDTKTTVKNSNLAIGETTYHTFNTDIYLGVNEIRDSTILTWMRAVICNIISTNGYEWSMNFNDITAKMYNTAGEIVVRNISSYTYNNNWYTVDYAILNELREHAPNKKITHNILKNYYDTHPEQKDWLVFSTEVVPQHVKKFNWLGELLQNNYLPSINVPEDKELYVISGYADEHAKEQQGENYWSYEETGRFKIFKAAMPQVKTEADFRKFIRMNKYQTFGEFCHYDPAQVIASRYDLRKPEEMQQHGYLARNPSFFGQSDAKYTRLDLSLKGAFQVVTGVTTDNGALPPLNWSGFDEKPKGVNTENKALWSTFNPDFVY